MDRGFLKHGLMSLAVLVMAGCKPASDAESRLTWGVHQSARSANLLNLLPNQSVEVCADKQDWVAAGQEAIQKWATAINRWGHIKVVNCGQSADLTINMKGFDSTGLNYFTARPGRIFLKSTATGNFLRAVALHEYGHSFGLCDQYKDAGSANCSDARSERQQNEEVMGATNASKVNLTMGDIEGVRKAASDLSVRANSQWNNYLLNNKNPSNSGSAGSGAQRKAYASLVAGGPADRPKMAISVAQGATFNLCRLQSGQSDCQANSPQAIQMEKFSSANGRDFYISSQDLSGLSANSSTPFIVTVRDSSGSSSEKFAIRKK